MVQEMSGYYRGLEWTTEPPAIVGWYWAKSKIIGAPLAVVQIVQSPEKRRSPELYAAGSEWAEFSDYTHFLGPLPAPYIPGGGDA